MFSRWAARVNPPDSTTAAKACMASSLSVIVRSFGTVSDQAGCLFTRRKTRQCVGLFVMPDEDHEP
jgi:hypothetical protein